MTMVPSRISTWLVLLLFAIDTRLIVAQTDNPVFSFPSSIQLTAAERGHLSSSSRNGNVFVVAGNVLYRLSSQLQQLQSVSVSPIVALTTTDDGEWLVACFTTRTCTAYNTSDLNTMDTPTENANLFPTIITSIALFTAPIAGLPTIYIGSGDVSGSTRRFDLVQRGFAGSTLVERFESSSSTTLTRRMYGGFLYDNNSYFLALDSVTGLPPTMYIIRVCNDGQFAARYELQLTCGGALSMSSVITGVSEVNGALVVSMDGRVCSYNLATINMTLNEHFQTCLIQQSGGNSARFVTGSGGPVACNSLTSGGSKLCNFATTDNRLVLNAGSSSGSVLINGGVNTSLAISVEENSFLFVGTSNSVDKYLVTVGGGITSLYSMSVSFAVTALSWSPAVDYVYVTAGNQVVRLPLETCSNFATCNSCVTNGDPLCGWCSVENKCSRRTQCQNNTDIRRYLTQGEQTSCTDTVVFDPPQFVSEIQSVPYQVNLTFNPASPPPLLSGEEFLCVFSNVERGITFNTTLNNQTMSCDLTSSLPPLTDIKLVTRFSVHSTQSGESFFSVENGYTFYNCSHGANCQGCVDTEGNCGWCVYDFSCTGQSQDCSVPDSFVTLNTTNQSYTNVCPVLSPPPNTSDSGAYVQPVNVNSPLTVSGSNLPLENDFIQYMCVFGTTSRPAQRVNSTVVMCDGQVSLSPGISGRENATFQLMLRNGSNVYTLDTSTGGNVFVVLYQCSDLATECSSCLAQRMGTDFQCGWCGSTCVDVSDTCSAPSSFVVMSSNCPAPMISNVSPDSGPTSGGTTVNITGTNLGTSFSDIISIRVGSLTCTPRVNSYMVGRRITCDIVNGSSSQTQAGSVDVVITVRRMGGDNGTATAQFRFGLPRVYSVSPSFGPVAGGTMVRVRGEDLNIGNTERSTVSLVTTPVGSGRRRRRRQTMGSVSCNIMTIAADEITCVWSNFTASMSGVVQVTVDSAVVQNQTVTYQYLNNPVYEGLIPQQTIRAGGIRLTFTGQYLNVSQQPTLQFNIGPNAVNSTCQVDSSGTSLEFLAPPLTELNNYTVIMDAAPGPDTSDNDFSLMLVDNPEATGIREESRRVDLGMNSTITIEGQRINNVLKEEITVMVGQDQCVVQTTGATIITCVAPQRNEPVIETVMVMFGQNLTSSPLMLEYASQASIPIAAIGGGVGGGVIVLVILFIVCFIPLIVYMVKQSKQKDKKFTNLLVQMESMELEMADQCKQAFAELQTDLGELVAEDVLDKHHLPFHDFATYAMRFLFPSADKNHPVLSLPKFPRDAPNEQFTTYLEEFKGLVFDKRFLFSYVRTLESQQKFNLQDKCNVASLLMVACQNDLPYVTEILMVLLKELIRRSISQSRNHPKLLLRRTECVAEKLLANWLCFLLYPHLLEHAGAPLFVLYRAIKSQLEKCPVDVVTGEARNSLSEEKLLRQPLDFKVLECEVETGNHDEVLSIRLLDSDSISQAKEKILDLIYKNVPVSDRPRLDSVELELCRGNAGIPLRDQDATTRKDGEWTKINTLGYYGIAEMADAAVEDPKKPTPRFRLQTKPERPFSGTSFDFPGTLVASQSMTSQSSLLASVQDGPSRMHLYHLVKPDIATDTTDGPGGGQKIMTEVFLTRLLSTKRILQDYVNTLFHTIFASPRAQQSAQLPRAIKYLFDFLDSQAAELNITDSEVLHTWKTNSLPLRFWVNLIKNPEFLFDINKSVTVDSCLTVIAQAYIDACSTTEVRYTKDTPSARLLYANEVKEYKEEVTKYYRDVQAQPVIPTDEMNVWLREASKVYLEANESHHFYSDSALLELYRYACRYGDEITEALTEDKLVLVASQFSNLRHKLVL